MGDNIYVLNVEVTMNIVEEKMVIYIKKENIKEKLIIILEK